VVDFRNTVVIMTSNIGSSLILEAGEQSGEGWGRVEATVRDQLRLHFRPEFLNRVDDIIVFRQLGRADIGRIAELQLSRLRKQLEERRIQLRVMPDADALLAEEGYDPVFGARPLKRVIQRRLQNPIALELLEGRYRDGDTIRVERAGTELRFVREAGVPESASA
jgi:ATP-dependent Clp protease ATP-binding subunit ClpB